MFQVVQCHRLESSVEDLRAENERLRAQVEELTRAQGAALAELRHRVVNHFQLLASLIGLRLRQTTNSESREHLLQLRDCVLSLGLLQGRMDAPGSKRQFGDYLAEQAALWRSICAERNIRLHVDSDDVTVVAQKAVPLALIVNELVTNCFKHAFPGRTGGSIRIGLKHLEDGQAELSVSDDGVGSAAGDSDHTSFGLKLVKGLAAQLNGSVDIEIGRGATVRVLFPPN